MNDEIVEVTVKFHSENGDLKVKSNCHPQQVVSLLEMAKHRALEDMLGGGFSKISNSEGEKTR